MYADEAEAGGTKTLAIILIFTQILKRFVHRQIYRGGVRSGMAFIYMLYMRTLEPEVGISGRDK